jgi:NADPH2 dehydrogenase
MQGEQHQKTSNKHTRLTMATSKLFQPIEVGTVALQHRVVMAPVTRYRGNTKHTPTDLVVEHYAARASIPGTLIISEATYITHKASGDSFNVPGIWSDEQAAAWKKVGLLCSATHVSTCNSDHFTYQR